MGVKGSAAIGKAQAKASSDAFVLAGEKAMRRKLKALETKVQARVAHRGVVVSVQVLAKQMKKDIPSRFKEARKGVGWRVTKGRGVSKYRKTAVPAVAKAGNSVGIKKGKRLNALFKQIKAQDDKAARGGRPGIGIGKFNFHWWVLGTGSRFTKTGRATGSTRKRMPGWASKAALKARPAVKVAMAMSMRKELLKEAKKLR